MKMNKRLVSIIAVVTVMGFSFIACSDELPEDYLWRDGLFFTYLGHDGYYTVYGEANVYSYPDGGGIVTGSSRHDPDKAVSVTSITIPSSVNGFPVGAIGSGAFHSYINLVSVTIPNSVTAIGWDAFSGCTSLASVTIPDSVTSIGTSAFSGCTNLTSVTIPDSVITIDPYAFNGCTSLASLTIPDSVTSIGGSAFRGCTNLTSVTIVKCNFIKLYNTSIIL